MLVYKYRSYDNLSRDLNSLCNNQYYASPFLHLNDPTENTFNETLSDAFNLLEHLFAINADECRKHFNRLSAFSETLGIYSLTDSPFNQLMWSHYASSHKGLVVEYDLDKLLELTVFPSVNDINTVTVKYRKSPPIITIKDIDANGVFLQKLFGTKSLSWKYENEIRIITDTSGLRSYFPSALKAIYFGLKFPESKQKEVIEQLRHPNLRFYKIICKRNSYQLDKILIYENTYQYGIDRYNYEYLTNHNSAVENFYIKYKGDFRDKEEIKLFLDLFLEKHSDRRRNIILANKEFDLSKTENTYDNFDYIESHKIAELMVDCDEVLWGIQAPK